MSSSPDPDLEAGQQVGEYVVEDKLGQGGFGAVFKATHPVIGKLVALKVLMRKFSVDPEMVERFVAEARAVNQIRHRNIIDIFSFGQLADGRHYYAMEYLEGDPLDALITRDGAMPLADALPILRSIARALDACHAKGIAHRDLKPANIFLAREPDGDRYPKLLDFGIAKLMGPEEAQKQKTRTGVPMGTPYYMSPEQCRGRDVDHRTDYYAFGIVAYELLTGVVPFDGEDYMAILMSQISDEPAPPSSVKPELAGGIDDAILWLMKKDPAARPPSLVAAVQALEAAAEASGVALPIVRETRPRIPVSASAQTMPSGALAVPPPRSRTKMIVASAIAVVVIGAAAFVAVSMTGGGKPAPAATIATPTPTPPTPPTPTPTPDKPVAVMPVVTAVTVTITGVPDGTEVLVRGALVGTAPGPVQLDRGTTPVVLMLRADGYAPLSRPITPDKDQPLELHLKKKGGAAPAAHHDGGKDDLLTPSFK